MAQQKETNLKNRVIPRLKALPLSWVCKVQQLAKSGTPDILLNLGGVFCAIELKTDEGKLSHLQEYNLDKIADCGGLSMVITPSNFHEAMRVLERLALSRAKVALKTQVFGKETT